MVKLVRLINRFNIIPIKILTACLTELEKIIQNEKFPLIWNQKSLRISKVILSKRNKARDLDHGFQVKMQSYNVKAV